MCRIATLSIVVLSGISLSGCASIVSGRHAEVAVDSYPTHAHVDIHDKHGRRVSSFQTPGVAKLKRQGKYFMPAKYTATIVAPGFEAAQVPIRSTVNPWVLGNVVIGGVPGLVIDSATGAAWKPNRDEIHRQLQPLPEGQYYGSYSANPAAESVEPAAYVADESSGQSDAAE
jgi:uncharacterized protein YceK